MAEVRRTLRVTDPDGLHARPCARVARELERFRSEVVLVSGGRSANARSVLELLGLGVLSSGEIEIRATGADADECARAVEEALRESV